MLAVYAGGTRQVQADDVLQSGDVEQTAEYEALRSSCERAMAECKLASKRHKDFVREYLAEHPKVAKLVGTTR